MTNLKIINWNMEWMNDLFDTSGNFRQDGDKPQHNKDTTIKQRRDQLSGVIDDLSPEIVMIVEGPNTQSELKKFFDADVSGTWEVALQPTSGSAQCIGCAVRTDTGKFDTATPLKWFDTKNLSEFNDFEIINSENEIKEKYRFERLPLYAEIKTHEGKVFRVMGVHLKSKGIFNALEWSKWWSIADANRKKILAQCSQIRDKFANVYLTEIATRNIPLMICGDINDGPGLDASEKRLYGSGIERLMGDAWQPDLCFGNALFDGLKPKDKAEKDFSSLYTASFKDPIFNNVWQRDWIDHILYSHISSGWVKNGTIIHEMPDGKKIYDKYKFASDHRPVMVDVQI